MGSPRDTGRGPDGELGETTVDLGPNVAAALAYLAPPMTGLALYLVEDENDFVRFHAVQSVIYATVAMAATFGFVIVAFVVAVLTRGYGAFVTFPLVFFVIIGLVGYQFFVLYRVFEGERYRIRGIAGHADRYAS